VNVPAELYVVVRLLPVPVDGVPPVAVQAKVYGDVPPVVDAVNVSAVPTVPVVGPVIDAASVSGEIVIDAVPVAVFVFASVAKTDTEYVPLVL
jgi:hypothetical protein